MADKAWKKRPGKCPSGCDRGNCARTCEKVIGHGVLRDEDGKTVPGGKLHDCGQHK